jgi:hypothetical protein
MLRIIALVVLLLAPIGSNALAQNLNGKQPSAAAAAKRERCDMEGRNMGLSNQWNRGAGGSLRRYVAACMKR